MRIKLKLPILIICFLVSAIISHSYAQTVSAARLLFSPSSGTMVGQTQIEIQVDTEGETVDSAVAVFTYNSSSVDIVSITDEDFFDNVSTDTSVAGEVAITGTMGLSNTAGVTGSGKLATIVISPKISTGTITLSFRCNSTDIDDSNIMSTTDTNLLATNEQCSRNIAGSYNVNLDTAGTTTAPTNVPTNTPAATQAATTKGGQPALPDELPQSGPLNWLRWLTSGLALIGIGLLLL